MEGDGNSTRDQLVSGHTCGILCINQNSSKNCFEYLYKQTAFPRLSYLYLALPEDLASISCQPSPVLAQISGPLLFQLFIFGVRTLCGASGFEPYEVMHKDKQQWLWFTHTHAIKAITNLLKNSRIFCYLCSGSSR